VHQFATLGELEPGFFDMGDQRLGPKTKKLLVSAPWPPPITKFIRSGKKRGYANHRMPVAVQILALLAAFGGLLAGLLLLNREPLFGVLGMLGSMALLLESLTRFRGASTTLFRTRHTEEITDGREH
jgi:hypothetical protein